MTQSGQHSLITGATQGLGPAVVQAFEGGVCRHRMFARDPAKLDAVRGTVIVPGKGRVIRRRTRGRLFTDPRDSGKESCMQTFTGQLLDQAVVWNLCVMHPALRTVQTKWEVAA